MAMMFVAVLWMLALPAYALDVVAVVDGVWVSRVKCQRPYGADPYRLPAPAPKRTGPEVMCVEWEGDRCVRRSIQMEWRAK